MGLVRWNRGLRTYLRGGKYVTEQTRTKIVKEDEVSTCIPDRGEKGVHVPHQARRRQAYDDEVGVFEQDNDPGRVDPTPQGLDLLCSREALQFVASSSVYGLRQEEDDHQSGCAGHGDLQPEDVAPGCVCDDYTCTDPLVSFCADGMLCRESTDRR